MRKRLGNWLRRAADHIDRDGAIVLAGLSVTLEGREGWVVHGEMGVHRGDDAQPGMRLLYDPRTYNEAFGDPA